jgi:alanyl-tRNA synthetase
LSDDELKKAEDLANEVIFQNRPVAIDFIPHDRMKEIPLRKIPDREEETYRIITIEDFDWSACGGTHCNHTGSVGIIKVTGQEKVHGNFRIHFLTGLMALDDYRWRYDQIEKISNIFTRHGRESLEAVKNLVEENAALRKKAAELQRQMLPANIDKWYNHAVEVNGRKVIALDFSGEDFKEARQAALGIINKYEAVAVIGVDDKLLVAVSQNVPLSAADILKMATDRFGGRGGGSPQLAQGGGFKADDIKVLIAAPEKILDI